MIFTIISHWLTMQFTIINYKFHGVATDFRWFSHLPGASRSGQSFAPFPGSSSQGEGMASAKVEAKLIGENITDTLNYVCIYNFTIVYIYSVEIIQCRCGCVWTWRPHLAIEEWENWAVLWPWVTLPKKKSILRNHLEIQWKSHQNSRKTSP